MFCISRLLKCLLQQIESYKNWSWDPFLFLPLILSGFLQKTECATVNYVYSFTSVWCSGQRTRLGPRRTVFRFLLCHGNSLGNLGPVIPSQPYLPGRVTVRIKQKSAEQYCKLLEHLGKYEAKESPALFICNFFTWNKSSFLEMQLNGFNLIQLDFILSLK